MVQRRRKQKGPDYSPELLDSIHITRSLLKKLVVAKCVPEIYKEVYRSQHRKRKLFKIDDDPERRRRSRSISSRKSTVLGDSSEDPSSIDTDEERSLLSDCTRKSASRLWGSDSSDDDDNEETETRSVEALNPQLTTLKPSEVTGGVTNETTPRKLRSQKEVVAKVSRKEVQHKESNCETVNMSPKVNPLRKSVSCETRPPGSPGVMTRSQLRQLTSSKKVPEEHCNIEETSTPKTPRKRGQSVGTPKKQTPPKNAISRRRDSVSVARNRSSKCENVADTVEKSNSVAHTSLSENISSIEACATNIPPANSETNGQKEIGNISKDNRKNTEINDSNSNEAIQVTPNSKLSIQERPSSLHKESNVKESEEKIVTQTRRMSRKLQKPKLPNAKNTPLLFDSDETSEGLNVNPDSLAKGNVECNKNFDSDSSLNSPIENIDGLQETFNCKMGKRSESQKNSTKESQTADVTTSDEDTVCGDKIIKRCSSICEPVDMSISEGLSGTDKISCFVKSKASGSETSEVSTKHFERCIPDSSQLKLEKLGQESTTAFKNLKYSEASCVTSSSYNSGHEIAPSKTCITSESKDCSVSTKTTDSGVTGTFDSNQYCDTDSSSSDNSSYNFPTIKAADLNKSTNLKEKVNIATVQTSLIPAVSSNMNQKTTIKVPNTLQVDPISVVGQNVSDVRNSTGTTRIHPPVVEEASDSDSDAESRKAIMLSAQRRIEQNLSTTDSESRRYVPRQVPAPILDADDSDEAPPDSMTFEAGRSNAAESLRDAVESIRRDRQRRKEKRRARLEKLRQQKEEKLIRLKERMASQEDASCSSSEESGYEEEEARHYKKKPTSREKLKADNCVKITKPNKKATDGDGKSVGIKSLKDVHHKTEKQQSGSSGLSKRLPEELLERLSEKAPEATPAKLPRYDKPEHLPGDKITSVSMKKRKKGSQPNRELSDGPSDVQSFKKPCSLDYIPLKSTSSTKFAAMSLDKVMKAPKSTAQQAAEFRQNMMFGNRHKREPGNTNLIYMQKLKAAGRNMFARKNY